MKETDKIITADLLESAEQLHGILKESGISNRELENHLIDWANGLLEMASANEPGQISLVPYLPIFEPEEPEPEEEPGEVNPQPASNQGHQTFGSGAYNRSYIRDISTDNM